jgi:5-methylthioadenosine/S-adenosylhomocysteine deaminase
MKPRILLIYPVLIVAALGAALIARADTLLVKNALLITMAPGQEEQAFKGYMTVGHDGKITAVVAGDVPAGVTADRVLDAEGKFVAPGFISAHSHLAFSPLRGVGHDETLYGWIRASTRFLNLTTADDIYWFTLHGSLGFLREGITTAYDFTTGGTVTVAPMSAPPAAGAPMPAMITKPGPFQESQIKAKADAGLRFINSIGVPRNLPREEAMAWFGQLQAWTKATYGSSPLYIKTALSGGLQWGTKETAFLEAAIMKKFGVMNESHFLESPDNVPDQQAKFDWYVESGALSSDFIFGHFIQTTPRIVAAAAKAGASMSWQPASNARLASGVADIPLYRAFGMKIAVGLDNQNCTDTSDPFQNLRIGLALIRTKYKDAKALSVRDMLFFHTRGSAEVLKIDDIVGSLAPGKFADFLIVDPRDPDTGPLHDPIATYVLACGQRNLKQVYVGGKLVVDEARILTRDESEVRREIDARVDRLRGEIAIKEAAASAK